MSALTSFAASLRARRQSTPSDRGAILVLSALVMILLLLIAAFATDLGAWYRQGQSQQRAADVGSLNGIQTYQAEIRQDFSDMGVSAWDDIASNTVRRDLETKAMEEAVNSVVGLFEAAGVSISNPATYNIDPPPSGESTATITADDGTVIVITRNLNAEMILTVSKPGQQYFSSLIRDAPDIVRESTSTLSNCGAVCRIPIEINPPFTGFQATGKGDGYGPLLYGEEEIWAVNHHNFGSQGDIICMDRETQAPCRADGQHYALGNYQTGNRPVEYIDVDNFGATGKIYFASSIKDSKRSGLACFDVVARRFCNTPYVDLFDMGTAQWPNTINASGPWEYNGKLYVLAQDGQLGCVTKAMTTCGIWETAAFGHPNSPNLLTETQIAHGEQLGSKLYVSQDTYVGQIFHCWDFATSAPCWGGTVHFVGYMGSGSDDHLTHFRYSSTGVETGICTSDIIGQRNACVSLDGSAVTEIVGLKEHLKPLKQDWGGDAITWNKERTFFAGGNSNRIACWDWTTNSACQDVTTANPAVASLGILNVYEFAGKKDVAPYGFAQVSEFCIIGLGHNSIFYSFNPKGMSSCVDTEVETKIEPCTCANGDNKWGEVQIPDELLNMVDDLVATVRYDNGTQVLTDVDLIAEGGVLDLSPADPNADFLWLKLEVKSRLNLDGTPVWTDPITADLQLVVQPTLTD